MSDSLEDRFRAAGNDERVIRRKAAYWKRQARRMLLAQVMARREQLRLKARWN